MALLTLASLVVKNVTEPYPAMSTSRGTLVGDLALLKQFHQGWSA